MPSVRWRTVLTASWNRCAPATSVSLGSQDHSPDTAPAAWFRANPMLRELREASMAGLAFLRDASLARDGWDPHRTQDPRIGQSSVCWNLF